MENILATLSSMLNSGKNWGYICEPVVLKRLVLPPRSIRQQARAFNPDQAQRIIQVPADPCTLMFAIAAYTGIRAGEIMGLRAEDIDLHQGIMTIRQNSLCGTLQAPKSEASENSIPIPMPLVEMLKKYSRKQGFLFVNAYGRRVCALGGAIAPRCSRKSD